jgi:hypothetical protein
MTRNSGRESVYKFYNRIRPPEDMGTSLDDEADIESDDDDIAG